MARGGAREGAGRPKGSTSVEEVRKNRTMRATEEEWEVIKLMAKKVKIHGVEKAYKWLEEMN